MIGTAQSLTSDTLCFGCVQDRGEPPLSSSSFLIVNVQDVDDMGPAFTDKVYYAEVLGERSVGVGAS